MMNNTIQSIEGRRSIRMYKPDQISQKELDVLLHAGVWAPSARNKQLRHITVVQNSQLLDEFSVQTLQILNIDREGYHLFHRAPAVLVLSAEVEAEYRCEDIGIMTQSICLAAQSIGLGTCILGLPQALFLSPGGAPFIKKMGIPEGYEPILSISVGYPTGEEPLAKPRNFDIVNYAR